MVVAALVCFGILLVAWILAPDARPAEVQPTGLAVEPLPQAA